jgi:tetratricopeptide (TPR) repeat protein
MPDGIVKFRAALGNECGCPRASGRVEIALDKINLTAWVMATHQEAIAQARWYYQAGNLQEAERRYREILQVAPFRADLWYDLGVACHLQGKLDDARASYEKALQLKPDDACAHNNLGAVRAAQGRLDEAVASYRRALHSQPSFADAYNNLGVALNRQGKPEEAAASFRQCLMLNPGQADAHNNLGNALRAQGRLQEAVDCFRRALELRPHSPDPYNGLSVTLIQLGQPDEALVCLREAVTQNPWHADTHNNLGNVFSAQNRLEEAVASYQRALELRPDHAEACNNLGLALAGLGRLEEAVACHQRALQLRPDYAEAYVGLGATLRKQGRWQEEVDSYERALEIQPDHVMAHLNRALAWLLQGDFEAGWPEYEWRCKRMRALRTFSQPRWEGEPQPGKTILLHAEQGLGDTIQFIRYAPLVKQRVGTVIVECQRPLIRLLRSCAGIDNLVAAGEELPPFDIQLPLLSLPLIMGTTLTTVPADIPYLKAQEQLVDWQNELTGLQGFKVGIAWQGNPEMRDDSLRSIPLLHFAPLAEVPGVTLVSLQTGPGTEQLANTVDKFRVTDWSNRLDVNAGPFMDTAAVMENCDLVVTCDTVIAHLAGALGVPVWVALASVPSDYRWLLGREDSPWYPSMRLFRQRERGDWGSVFERIAAAVRGLQPSL